MKFPSEIRRTPGERSSQRRRSALACLVLASLAFGCGDGDEDEAEPKPACALGVTFSGALEATFSVADEPGCGVLEDDDGVDVFFYPLRVVQSVELRIGDLAEGQAGEGFPADVFIDVDDTTRFVTSVGGCTATVSENRLERTEMSVIGERRHRQVVGTGTCGEPAVGPIGEVTIGDFAFRIPSVWRD